MISINRQVIGALLVRRFSGYVQSHGSNNLKIKDIYGWQIQLLGDLIIVGNIGQMGFKNRSKI